LVIFHIALAEALLADLAIGPSFGFARQGALEDKAFIRSISLLI
jgi:hypothetical protein